MSTLPRRLGAMVMFGFSIAAVAAPVFARADGTGRRFAVSGSLQPQHATAAVFGTAFTAQTRLGKSAESSMGSGTASCRFGAGRGRTASLTQRSNRGKRTRAPCAQGSSNPSAKIASPIGATNTEPPSP